MRLFAGLAMLLLAVCFATDALAHASLVSVEPRDGSVLAQAPSRVELRFNENVTAGAVRVIDAAGTLRNDAKIEAAAETIAVTLPDGLPSGTSMVSYRVISQDGHPVTGTVTFSVGVPTATAMPIEASANIDVLIWLARIGLYVGLFAGVGGVFFIVWIGRSPAGSSVVLAALAIGLVNAVASLGLLGLDVLGLPLSGIVGVAPWTIALGTSLGPALLIAIAAMAASLFAWRRPLGNVARLLSALALAGVGVSLAATGHAATAPPELLTRPAMALHGASVAFWLGALAPLTATMWQQPKTSLPVVRRFSAVAMPLVGVLALAGLALATVQLGRLGALAETTYGIILSIKLALVALLVGLAALNRFRLTPALAQSAEAAKPLARAILAECVMAMAILLLVAGLQFTPPPRTLVPETPLAVHIHTDTAMFQVLISPARVGTDSFVLQLMSGDGSLLSAKETMLSLSLPDRGIEAVERTATLEADGYWHVRDVPLPIAGRWHMRIDALVTDFEKVTLEDDFDVATR